MAKIKMIQTLTNLLARVEKAYFVKRDVRRFLRDSIHKQRSCTMFLCASSVTNMLWLHTIYKDVFKGYLGPTALFLNSLNNESFVEITN